jgi:dUTP pyrophosphatase
MQVKVKKLHEKAVIPEYQSAGAACFDLVAVEKTHKPLKVGFIIEYDIGLAFEIPKGHVGLIFPRSSVTSKTSVSLGNCVGVIDSDYRGSVKFQFRKANHGGPLIDYNPGDRVGQMMILPIPQVNLLEVQELSDTDRGTGGFGSTDK